ncbi:hypothetical protein OVA07_02960 [Novosphingobium sp. SL115]|uniref:Dyp-type peroxidase n=1 Tax=Novosphingobium sp. SL115 TaxID=2995150 RepID=UPI002276526E|nr:hypothetical protein [Novosphingobium sp. SL115]MCY1669968.1 hypothetical protein [Novosphingobium sp. SL115]
MNSRAHLLFAETTRAPWLPIEQSKGLVAAGLKTLWSARQLLALSVALPWLIIVAVLWLTGASLPTAMAGAIAPALVITVLLTAFLAWLLARDEAANTPVDRTPSPRNLAAITARENAPGFVQNHMISVTRLRTAPIRRLSLSLAFNAIATMARLGLMRAGFLSTIGTIHAARWLVLPGTRQLVFTSNYGGSWESYLEDFITKSARGVTGVWSNTEGFPATSLLFCKGAEDGDRMKRFARCSMKPTAFWFSAYPDLAAATIRKQALIVSGLICRQRVSASPSDAEAWLDLFGTIPRPDYGLQYGEIQTLMFGGLRRHPNSRVVTFRFDPDGEREGDFTPRDHVRRWLADLIRDNVLSFGDKPPESFVCNIAFSAQGLARLGLADELGKAEGAGTAQGFPPAFALGMQDEGRKRALGDPATLDWDEDKAHVALLFYAKDEAAAHRIDAEIARAKGAGLVLSGQIETGLSSFDLDAFKNAWNKGDQLPEKATFAAIQPEGNDELSDEPFGFVDGISQPLVRGFPGGHGAADPVHAVEPGEFILGYSDNRGHFPPSPMVEGPRGTGGLDPTVLPAPAHEQPCQYPDFSAQNSHVRDFGRNGSYLVIRQLGQDVSGFNAELDSLAHKICASGDVINPFAGNLARTREWIAAKMVGRWRDGSTLVDNPFRPAFKTGQDAIAANSFLYKDADPQGQRCPFGAHVRRTFPRDSLAQTDPVELSVSNRHRLLRRGRPYLDKERKTALGTLFMCFNADIERQFEFVQQTWLGSPCFHGLEREPDPFVMHHGQDASEHRNARFTIPGRNAAITINPLQRHVTLRGGGYFFMPGRRALWFLAGPAFTADPAMHSLKTAAD